LTLPGDALPFFRLPPIPYLKISESLGVSATLAAKGHRHRVLHRIDERMDPVSHTTGFKSTTCMTCPKLDYLLTGGPEPEYLAENLARYGGLYAGGA
jgi:hypothetical protein